MKADIVICHPRDTYYPYWAYQMNQDRELFGRIIIVMTEKLADRDYTNYLKTNLIEPTIIEKVEYESFDWRDAATNEALKYVVSPMILLLDQDFLTMPNFYKELLEKGEKYNTVGFHEGGEERFHCACLLVKTEIMNKTKKDFSIEPDISDQFTKFTRELVEFGNYITLEELNLPAWYHMAGVTHNYRLNANWFKPEEFYTYMKLSDKLASQPKDWREFNLKKMEEMNYRGELSEKIKSFFEAMK